MSEPTPFQTLGPKRMRRLWRRVIVSIFILSIQLPWLAAQSTVPTEGPQQHATKFSYADLFKLRSVQDVSLSPDGKNIVFVVSAADINKDGATDSVWLLRIADHRLLQVSPTPSRSPVWSSDSHQLAIVTQDVDGKPEITLVSADDPNVRRTFRIAAQPGSLAWSPDKRWLVVTLFVPDSSPATFLQKAVDSAELSLNRPPGSQWASPVRITQEARYQADGSNGVTSGRQHLFLISTGDGKVRQLTSGPFDDNDPSWLPDSSGLLFASDRQSEPKALVRVPAIQRVMLVDSAVTQVSHGHDYMQNPVASPDGRWIAYTSSQENHVNYSPSNLNLMQVDGGQPHRLAPQLDRDVYGQPQWSIDSRSVFDSFIDHGLARVGRFDLDGGVTEVAAGTQLSFSRSQDGDLAYAGASNNRPAEVYYIHRGANPTSLTSLNSFLNNRAFGHLLHLDVPSTADGVRIEGWVVLPPNTPQSAKLPTILDLHGGPFGFDDPGWSSEQQLYAAAGFAVVFVNYRGSTSYGFKFAEPANYEFPQCAYSGLMSVMDEVVRLGIADPNRLFITGGSAGGELTTWTIGKTNRFRAAAAYKPVINELSNALENDQYLQFSLKLDPPWAAEPAFWSLSPLSLVGSVSTPTLLITGDEDKRTPLTETLQYYGALQLRGIPAALVTVPGASHESLRSRPSQLAAETAATIAWFRHYDPGPNPRH